MSFEELQKKWNEQFAVAHSPATEEAEKRVLESIRQAERRFRLGMVLLVLRDAVLLMTGSWILWLMTHPIGHWTVSEVQQHRTIRFILLGTIIGLSLASDRLSSAWKHLTPTSTGGLGGLLARVGGDQQRFDRLVWWRDLREAGTGFMVTAMAVLQAQRVASHSAPVWIGAGLFATLSVGFLVYRLLGRTPRAPADETMLGLLTYSIAQTRRQVRMLDNVWWYLAPIMMGGFLAGPLQRALSSESFGRRFASECLFLVVVGALVWHVNRKVARTRLAPRLAQLEELKAELMTDSNPSAST